MDGASTVAETTASGSSIPVGECSKNRLRCETVSTTCTDGAASLYDTQHAAAAAAAHHDDVKDVPRWFPRCCGNPILHGKPEALGFLLGLM
jgi:predicted short-subunit dehydrogenase-like oxidoreductase (DUF2520 family)